MVFFTVAKQTKILIERCVIGEYRFLFLTILKPCCWVHINSRLFNLPGELTMTIVMCPSILLLDFNVFAINTAFPRLVFVLSLTFNLF